MVLLRQAPTGLEVLLLRRTAQAANMPGLYVSPAASSMTPIRRWRNRSSTSRPKTCAQASTSLA